MNTRTGSPVAGRGRTVNPFVTAPDGATPSLSTITSLLGAKPGFGRQASPRRPFSTHPLAGRDKPAESSSLVIAQADMGSTGTVPVASFDLQPAK